jgi:TonB family protein
MLDRYRLNILAQDRVRDDLELERMIDTNTLIEEENRDKGSPGNARGKGGGSGEEQKRPTGGGGGGDQSPTPASNGKIPKADLETPQIIPPKPETPRLENPSLPTPTIINADPILFPEDTRDVAYGDPKSKSTDPSAGPGKNGGIGTGEDGGLGTGKGKGFGPGEGKNTGGGKFDGPTSGGPGGPGGKIDYDKIFPPNELQQRAQITFKPQPEYTEDARKNQIQGVVRIQMVLAADGTVKSVRAVSSLPHGLTEKALQAAKRIQFIPAKKDDRNVSQWVTVEYNFRIY